MQWLLGDNHGTVLMDASFFTESCNLYICKTPSKSKSSEKVQGQRRRWFSEWFRKTSLRRWQFGYDLKNQALVMRVMGSRLTGSDKACVKALSGTKSWLFSKNWKTTIKLKLHCSDGGEGELMLERKGRAKPHRLCGPSVSHWRDLFWLAVLYQLFG